MTPYGRDAELAKIAAVMAEAEAGNRRAGVVLVGPAGMGKTTVWRTAIALARERGFTVLTCAPAAIEASLGLSSLADLLRDIPSARIDALPAPQRNALRAVLLADEPDDTVTDRATSAGLLTLFDDIAAEHPLCLAIDDVQWMDRSSRRALAFALRRLEGRSVFLVATLRDGSRAGRTSGLDSLLDGTQSLRLGPLSVGAMHHALLAALGTTFPHPTLIKITEWSGGNPLLAIELGRSIVEAGGTTVGIGRAPLTGRAVQRFLGRRIAALPTDQRRTVLIIALAEQGSREQVEEAHRRLGWRLSFPGASSGLIEVTEGTLRLAHPLFAEAVLTAASAAESSRVRRTLAAITHRADVRARHLAEATSGPEEDIALSLDDAAGEARGRGAMAEALELAELAVRRSPPGGSRHHERRLLHADLLFHAGDSAGSAHVLEETRAAAATDAQRVSALIRLARQGIDTRLASQVVELCRETIRLAGPDTNSAAEAHVIWAQVATPGEGQEHVRTALALLDPDAPGRLRVQATILGEMMSSMLGRAVHLGPVDLAVTLDRVDPPERVADRAQFTRAWLLLMADELSRARDDLTYLRRVADESGDTSSIPQILGNAGHLEIRAGNWLDARAISEEMLQISERSGQRFWSGLAHTQLGSVAALRGEFDIADEHLSRSYAIGVELEDSFIRFTSVMQRGVLALGDERYEEAAAIMATPDALAGAPVPDPGMTPWPGLAAEVLARVGRTSEAVVLADDLEVRARRTRRRRALAAVMRIRALIASANGDLDLGASYALDSSRILARMPAPFDHARSLLVLGTVLRRKRQRRASDTALVQAQEIFEQLGAAAWIRQVRAERARTGLRPRAPAGLTPTEATVARLSAEGRTNREVAQAAFISPKTVEANLSRVYQKLGIRTRAELGRRLDALSAETEGEPAD